MLAPADRAGRENQKLEHACMTRMIGNVYRIVTALLREGAARGVTAHLALTLAPPKDEACQGFPQGSRVAYGETTGMDDANREEFEMMDCRGRHLPEAEDRVARQHSTRAIGCARPHIFAWLLASALCFTAAPAWADDVHVMVSGGFTAAYKVLAAEWEKATGHKVDTVYGASMGATPTAIPNRLARGEQADIVILARSALDQLVQKGQVIDGSQVDLVRSRIGMAVKAGAKKPDISTEVLFKKVLLDAKSIAYSDSASGVYISTEMFKKLGIEDQVAGKAKMIPGTPVGEIVARGDAEIGFQQISELLPVEGVLFVGPIPDSVQLVTTFSAGVATTSKSQAAARLLIAYLSSKEASTTIRRTGLDPVAATQPAKGSTK